MLSMQISWSSTPFLWTLFATTPSHHAYHPYGATDMLDLFQTWLLSTFVFILFPPYGKFLLKLQDLVQYHFLFEGIYLTQGIIIGLSLFLDSDRKSKPTVKMMILASISCMITGKIANLLEAQYANIENTANPPHLWSSSAAWHCHYLPAYLFSLWVPWTETLLI